MNLKFMLVVIFTTVIYRVEDKYFILKWFADIYGGTGNLVPAILILAGAIWGGYQLFTGRAAGPEGLIKIKTGKKNKY